jgi:multimeric flavodoxin WrbA
MSKYKNALLLIGSPKVERSTSASLGNYLLSKLEGSGMQFERAFIHRIINREEKFQSLLDMINKADLLILSFPLYVDSLPAPVIKAMELIKEQQNKLENKESKDFIAICNSGFPEASQSTVALKICRIFSKTCGFIWKGGIAIGGGGAINGRPLEGIGGMVRFIIAGLDLTAQAIMEGKEIPQEAIDIASKPFIPRYLYIRGGNLGWRIQTRRYSGGKKIKNKPYLL